MKTTCRERFGTHEKIRMRKGRVSFRAAVKAMLVKHLEHWFLRACLYVCSVLGTRT
jgi:hypothetical protein